MPQAPPNPASQGRNVTSPANVPVSSSLPPSAVSSPSHWARNADGTWATGSGVRDQLAHPPRSVRSPQTQQHQGDLTAPDPSSRPLSQDQTLPPQTMVVEDGSDEPLTRQGPPQELDLPGLPGQPTVFPRHPALDTPAASELIRNFEFEGATQRTFEYAQQLLNDRRHAQEANQLPLETQQGVDAHAAAAAAAQHF